MSVVRFLFDDAGAASKTSTTLSARSRASTIAWTFATALLLMTTTIGFAGWYAARSVAPSATRFLVLPPEKGSFVARVGGGQQIAPEAVISLTAAPSRSLPGMQRVRCPCGCGRLSRSYRNHWPEPTTGRIYAATVGSSPSDLVLLPLNGERKPIPLFTTNFVEQHGQLSPDGRLAYRSNESGIPEIYVRPYPSGAGTWQISTGGGNYPTDRRRAELGGGFTKAKTKKQIKSERLKPRITRRAV